MALAWNICAPLGTLSTFFFNPVFQLRTAKNEINLFNSHVLIVAPVTFAPAGAMILMLPGRQFYVFCFAFLCSKPLLKKKSTLFWQSCSQWELLCHYVFPNGAGGWCIVFGMDPVGISVGVKFLVRSVTWIPFVIFGRNVEQEETMCHIQEW